MSLILKRKIENEALSFNRSYRARCSNYRQKIASRKRLPVIKF